MTAFDDATPNVARIYDYFLGGAHNFAVDRERAEEIVAAFPDARLSAWANRGFLRYAVEHALNQGVRQFLDLGSGIPTVGNVHEIVRWRGVDARVAYVDNDPTAVAHSAMLLADDEETTITDADLRDPAAVLAAPGVAGLLDFARPVAVLALGGVQYVRDDATAVAVLAGYRRHLAPGGLLALSHSSEDYPGRPDMAARHAELVARYATTSNPIRSRSRSEIEDVVVAAGFTPNGDGLRDVCQWADEQYRDRPLGAYALISLPV